ncbi:TIGR01440 family protein [Bacillus sp. BHET2]|uniref:TIGR01440 family protein n=1 Tax=Bacillus sp. BHET2 TaxID=2583818 RepID=UPI00110E9BF9|nr:TIGR01440 family protein [Bacillus sp. BHET2]TMU84027.1 TIGR01440 family protein [Bacillus sp. BHET2]
MEIAQLKEELQTILRDFSHQVPLNKGQVFVVGCSTSEVMGERIGTAGTIEVADMIFSELQAWADSIEVSLAFQCCEHLNRAIVLEREVAERKGLDEVTVIPVRKAGGAMATKAYHSFQDPVLVEHIKGDAGIDIGDTFIGMHLKHVAVPIRVSQKSLGQAHITLAKTRPKLIGGVRAAYE